MNNIGHIIVSEEVLQDPNGTTHIMNPLPMIIAIGIPTNFSFVISTGLINLKPGHNYRVDIELLDTESKSIVLNTIDMSPSDTNPESTGFSVLNMSCRNIPLLAEGEYTVRVSCLVDGTDKETKELILPIVKKLNQ